MRERGQLRGEEERGEGWEMRCAKLYLKGKSYVDE
jgi:hypothetical protein